MLRSVATAQAGELFRAVEYLPRLAALPFKPDFRPKAKSFLHAGPTFPSGSFDVNLNPDKGAPIVDMPNAIAWLVSAVGVVAMLVLAPFFLLIPAGVLVGGVSFGTTALILSLSIGIDAAGRLDGFFLGAPPAISAAFAFGSIIRRGIVHVRKRELPSLALELSEAFRHLLTLNLAVQIGLGSAFAVVGVLYMGGNSTMANAQALIVSLFAVFVAIMATTFTSYFMRSLIPWREEHPLFSNAVAYTLSVLLGLIAGIYAYIGPSTIVDASQIGAILYQASVAFGTLGATIVGAYIALQKKSRGPAEPPSSPGDR